MNNTTISGTICLLYDLILEFWRSWTVLMEIKDNILLTVKPGQAYPPPPQAPINEFIIKKLNPLVVVDFRFIIRILACVMSHEFTREAVTKFLPAQFP